MNKETIFFKKWLESLDNEKFYYFARNFLPQVTTPYNQIEVSEQLISFFLNEENANTMLSTIDEVDSLLIALFQITGGACSSDILKLLRPFENATKTGDDNFIFYSYFSKNPNIEEFDYVEIIDHISSLVKRMIILTQDGKFILNPIFGEDLLARASLKPFIEISKLDKEYIKNKNYISTDLLRGYFSIMKLNKSLTINQKKNILPPLFPTYSEFEILAIADIIDGLLLDLNIFTPFDCIEYNLLQALIDLTDFELSVLLIANKLGPVFDLDKKFFIFASELLKYSLQIKCFTRTSLILLCEALSIKFDVPVKDDFINLLIGLKIFHETSTGFYISNIKKEKDESQTLVFDTDLSVRYLGGRDKGDILWRFTELSSLDTQTIYQLTKEDFRDTLDSNIDKETIYNYVIENSFSGVNCPALKYLDLVEQQYSQISIFDGIIIQGNERVSKILSAHPDLQIHILNKLGENLFLMRRDTESTWTKLIENTGLLVPRRKGDIIQTDTFFTNEQWRIGKGYHLKEEQIGLIEKLKALCNINNVEMNIFTNELAKKTFSNKKLKIAIELLDCRKEEKNDLKSRLIKCMIINESQLFAPQVLDTNIVASGFDYRRKVNVFKMATKTEGTIVKIGYMKHEFLMVVNKVNTLGNNEYSVVAKRLPTLEEVELPINKIFIVKITNYITD
jgi:hypothetical protein